ncbi:glycoside hydrolase superfamily [Mycena olivaceomarginata]|nr:glycoside hydrolase superfamily [Mycena olivaceomarginata]
MFKLSSSVFSALVLSAVVFAYDPTRSDNLFIYPRTKLVRGNPWKRHAQLAKDNLELLPGAHLLYFSGGIPDLNLGNESTFLHSVFRKLNVFPRPEMIMVSLGAARPWLRGFKAARKRFCRYHLKRLPRRVFGSPPPFWCRGSRWVWVDLDIESGTNTGYTAFANRIRTLWAGASEPYYLTAAPQCSYPDAWVGNALSTIPFDAVYVQFYNGLKSYPSSFICFYHCWNYATWNTWAIGAPNSNVKIFIGAPASTTAANAGEYVSASTLGSIALATRGNAAYSHNFGGVMLWNASQAYGKLLRSKTFLLAQATAAQPEVAGEAAGEGGGCAQTYIVKSGDTCSAIESDNGISDAQLHALNPAINSGCTNLSVGQILCLSGGSSGCAQTYTVKSGDTCSTIESHNGISDAQLHALNPAINSGCTKCFLPDLSIGQILCLSGGSSSGCAQTYTVKSGDTCSAIEAHYGISDAQLHTLNPAINSGCTMCSPDLSIGQILCV